MRKQKHIQTIFGSVSRRVSVGAGTFLLVAAMGSASPQSSEARQSSSRPIQDVQPTAATGESWLTHLNRGFNETSMGKTGRLGPLEASANYPDSRRDGDPSLSRGNNSVIVHGSDLYRMNCRGCHGETGTGAPPEINSVINPVRATSTATVLERVRATGMEMSTGDAAKLAQQSRNLLLDRIHHGGHDMPAFPHLNDAEVNYMLDYMSQLSGVRSAENEQLAVREERIRIGEHIAKSTCHICHSAMGPNPSAQELYYGAIPPLSALSQRVTQAQFVRKVTQGAPILMGEPPQMLRGRMPVFYYLSEEEATDVYQYLTDYPPNLSPVLDAATVVAGTDGSDPGPLAGADPSSADTTVMTPRAIPAPAVGGVPQRGYSPTVVADEQMTILAILLGLLASMILCLGFWFTAHELKRLSRASETPRGVTSFKSPAVLTRSAARARSAALLL